MNGGRKSLCIILAVTWTFPSLYRQTPMLVWCLWGVTVQEHHLIVPNELNIHGGFSCGDPNTKNSTLTKKLLNYKIVEDLTKLLFFFLFWQWLITYFNHTKLSNIDIIFVSFIIRLLYDMVSDKGWKLGARRHKINYNFFSIGDPPKKFG